MTINKRTNFEGGIDMYGFTIDRTDSLSFTKQLQNQMRIAILDGKLEAGERLPPSRKMAKELSLSRNTIIQVYEQLIAEGYLYTIEGSGTYVVNIGRLRTAERPKSFLYTNVSPKIENGIIFTAGDPDATLFPNARWGLALRSASIERKSHSYPYESFAGMDSLRKEIRDYVYRVKGITCDYQQIIIASGTSGTLDLIARTFKKKNSSIVMEDPCIHFVKPIFESYEYLVQPVSVDEQGMKVEQVVEINDTDLIYVVPSHQFPLGGILPAARRIALLQYANEKNAYVIEDDYDCEFRYGGEPLQPLRNLDPERVIYCGSFSKIFSPSLRIGYAILPQALYYDINKQMDACSLWVNPTVQEALAELLKERFIDKHVYKMKKVYEKKRMYLMECLHKAFGTKATVSGENAGLHLLLRLHRDLTKEDAQAFLENGVEVEFVEEYSMIKGNHKNELVLGYGKLSFMEIEEGVNRLKRALERTPPA